MGNVIMPGLDNNTQFNNVDPKMTITIMIRTIKVMTIKIMMIKKYQKIQKKKKIKK